jgi:hypothetical protein
MNHNYWNRMVEPFFRKFAPESVKHAVEPAPLLVKYFVAIVFVATLGLTTPFRVMWHVMQLLKRNAGGKL